MLTKGGGGTHTKNGPLLPAAQAQCQTERRGSTNETESIMSKVRCACTRLSPRGSSERSAATTAGPLGAGGGSGRAAAHTSAAVLGATHSGRGCCGSSEASPTSCSLLLPPPGGLGCTTAEARVARWATEKLAAAARAGPRALGCRCLPRAGLRAPGCRCLSRAPPASGPGRQRQRHTSAAAQQAGRQQ